MWRIPSSRLLFRALLPGAAVNPNPGLPAEHRIRSWAHNLCSSSTTSPLASGAPDSSSSSDSASFNEAKRLMRLVNVEALKRKLGMENEEVIRYDELLNACEGMGVARTKEEAVTFAKVLDDAGVVLLFRDKVYLHPDKWI